MEAVFSEGTRSAGNRSSRALASNCIQFSILCIYLYGFHYKSTYTYHGNTTFSLVARVYRPFQKLPW